MRCYQHIGLNRKADEFLSENVERIPDIICPHCKELISTKLNILNTKHEDMFYGDGPDLRTFKLKDGRECKEIVQDAPWSSGPMGFLCLEISNKKRFEWKLNKKLCGKQCQADYDSGEYCI